MTEEEKKSILEMYGSGMGYKAISASTGIPASTVAYLCRKTVPEQTETCPQCGAKLVHTPRRKRKKFCSDKCRMLWWHSHQDQINRQAYYPLVCRQCGKEFISYGNDKRKYCSRKCYEDHRRRTDPVPERSEKGSSAQNTC